MKICYLVPGAMRARPGGQEEAARRCRYLGERSLSGAEIELVDDPSGPSSIESGREEQRAAAGVAERVGTLAGYDAIVIGCFGDPGIDAAREVSAVPVVGPAQASAHLAAQLGDRFGVLTVVDEVVPTLRRLMRRYGLEGSLAGVRAVEVPVLELRARRHETVERLESEAAALLAEGAEALVLGCMTMGFLDVAEQLQRRIGVPVVNPVLAGLHAAETIVAGGLETSRRSWPPPP